MGKNEITDHRKNLINSINTLSDSYDKYLLTFATGGLYLSIYFVKDVEKIFYMKFLLLSWISLSATIFFTLVSLLVGIYAFSVEIENLDNNKPQNKCLNTIINLLNILSLIVFVSGIGFLATFYYFNLK